MQRPIISAATALVGGKLEFAAAEPTGEMGQTGLTALAACAYPAERPLDLSPRQSAVRGAAAAIFGGFPPLVLVKLRFIVVHDGRQV